MRMSLPHRNRQMKRTAMSAPRRSRKLTTVIIKSAPLRRVDRVPRSSIKPFHRTPSTRCWLCCLGALCITTPPVSTHPIILWGLGLPMGRSLKNVSVLYMR